MKISLPKSSFFFLLFIVTISLSFLSCQKEENLVNCNYNNGSSQFGYITGKVVNVSGTGIIGVEIKVGNLVTYTNSKGEYFLSNVPAGYHVLVNFGSDIYTSTQKIAIVKQNRTSYVDAAMILIGAKQNVNASTGGTVVFNSAKVQFPANAIVDSKGNAFTGTVLVKATYFDPSGNAFYGCFPGEFLGIRENNSTTQIESFGFIKVDILNGTEKLQIASGKEATITMPISAKQLATAPQTIPLWYYDEVKGQWIEEGFATKTGSNYIGTVKHFSSWNCDQPSATSYLEGIVVDNNGNPLSNARVTSTGVDYTGQSSVNTSDEGKFKIAVKSNSTAIILAKYHIFSSNPTDYQTPATGQVLDIGTITIDVDTTNLVIIIGRVIDNGDLPVEYSYIKLLDSTGKMIDYISTTKDGKFMFYGRINSKYTIEIQNSTYDSSHTKIQKTVVTGSQGETIDLGDIKLDIGGSTIIGRVVDSSNNPLANVMVYSNENTNSQKERGTDSTGKFSLWVRPNKDIKVYFYYQGKSKTIDITSPDLGETKDLGDIVVP
jgi:protocatechuate 3,4-dioxygenase beta subunit